MAILVRYQFSSDFQHRSAGHCVCAISEQHRDWNGGVNERTRDCAGKLSSCMIRVYISERFRGLNQRKDRNLQARRSPPPTHPQEHDSRVERRAQEATQRQGVASSTGAASTRSSNRMAPPLVPRISRFPQDAAENFITLLQKRKGVLAKAERVSENLRYVYLVEKDPSRINDSLGSMPAMVTVSQFEEVLTFDTRARTYERQSVVDYQESEIKQLFGRSLSRWKVMQYCEGPTWLQGKQVRQAYVRRTKHMILPSYSHGTPA